MHESKKYQEHRQLVAVAVEHALITMGSLEFRTVQARLKEDYGITIEESLDNPECLKNILCDLFGNAYQDILDTIYQVIDGAKDEEIVKGFLHVMRS